MASSEPQKTNELRATGVRIAPERFYALLADGREIGVPYEWFKRLANATEAQRNDWRLIGGGTGIHWEEIDEDISVRGLLLATPRTRDRAQTP